MTEAKPILGFRGVIQSNICEVVHSELEQLRSLDLSGIQKVAEDTSSREIKRQLRDAELQLRQQAMEQRLKEELHNRQELQLLDVRAAKELQASRQLQQQIAIAASGTISFVAEKSSSLVRLKAKRDELLDAHRKSVVRLKKLESEVAKDVKSKAARNFVFAMRRRGEKATAQAQRKVVSELGRLLL